MKKIKTLRKIDQSPFPYFYCSSFWLQLGIKSLIANSAPHALTVRGRGSQSGYRGHRGGGQTLISQINLDKNHALLSQNTNQEKEGRVLDRDWQTF